MCVNLWLLIWTANFSLLDAYSKLKFAVHSRMDESSARKLICEVGKLLYERSYVVSSDGNVSIRLDENTVLATPTMTCKGRMTEDDLALTDMEGKPLGD